MLAAAVLFALLLCSCDPVKGWNIEELEKSEYPPVIEVTDVEMKIIGDTVEPDAKSAAVTITNLSQLEYGYGYEPRLEVKYDNSWYIIPTRDDVFWIMLWVILAPGTTNNETLPLSDYYGTLPAGTYRFVKVLSSDGNELPVAAEFIIS